MPVPRRQPGELEEGRGDVGQDAVAERRPAAARPTRRSGTGFSEWAVTGLPGRVAHLIGVAVVRGDREQGAGPGRVGGLDRLDRGDDPAEARVDDRERADRGVPDPVWPTMSGLA